MKSISTKNAPAAIGPYCQATRVGNFIFTSGQLAIDPKTGNLVPGGIKEQTKQAIENIAAILKAEGFSLDNVIKSNLYIVNMNDFTAMNEVYAQYFNKHLPARCCAEVSKLAKNGLIEIEVIAYKE